MTVGSIISGGFRLLVARPGHLLVWILVQFALAVATSYVMLGALNRQIELSLAGATEAELNLAYMWASLPIALIGLMVSAIIYAAVQRVVLRPGSGGPGALRLGMDEVRLFLLALLYIVVGVIAMVLLTLAISLFTAGAGRATLAAGGGILLVVSLVVAAYFCVKLSLTFPLTIIRGRFAIGEGWSLTDGRFWTLFGAYLVVGLILVAAGVAVMLATDWEYLSAVVNHGVDSVEANRQSVREFVQLGESGPDLEIILKWVLTAVQGGIGFALLGGSIATAAQELTADPEGLTDTFA